MLLKLMYQESGSEMPAKIVSCAAGLRQTTMDEKDQHVISRGSGGWAVLRTGAWRASKVFSTQGEAVEHARGIARKQQAALYVHKADGTVMSKESYRNATVALTEMK
jgi:hypothetical protein